MEAMITAITGSVDFAGVVTGLGTVAGALAVVFIAYRGAKMLLAAIRS